VTDRHEARWRRPEEVAAVVHRVEPDGRRYLVVLRAPHRQGYWHLVAGALEAGESPRQAAARELLEETGLAAGELLDLDLRLRYSLAEDPPEVRARFAPGVEWVDVYAFAAEAPPGWEPTLDDEHVEHRWLDADGAAELLAYPEPREAVLAAARLLEGT
jgi:8-oxo-dGTP pyrophosphatase MutT (NUDIX family)